MTWDPIRRLWWAVGGTEATKDEIAGGATPGYLHAFDQDGAVMRTVDLVGIADPGTLLC